MTEPRSRQTRADALRNRASILGAARTQITTHGPDVGMDEIAAAAGVAVGTLYRHFPNKTDLVAAVVSEFVARVADTAESAADRAGHGSSAFQELTGVLRDIVRATATNYAVKAVADTLNADVHDDDDVKRASGAIQRLIDSARTDRAVRDDLRIDDFYLLMGNAPADRSPAALNRWVDLMLFGIAGPRPPE